MKFADMGRGTQLLLVAGILLLIDSFLDWQQVSALGVTAGASMWHGVGVVAGLLLIGLLISEGVQVAGLHRNLELPVSAALISVVLAIGVAAFTVIKFLVANEARHWPAWIGLILAVVIAIGGWLKYQEAPTGTPATTPPAV
jgi:hypothetical protein